MTGLAIFKAADADPAIPCPGPRRDACGRALADAVDETCTNAGCGWFCARCARLGRKPSHRAARRSP